MLLLHCCCCRCVVCACGSSLSTMRADGSIMEFTQQRLPLNPLPVISSPPPFNCPQSTLRPHKLNQSISPGTPRQSALPMSRFHADKSEHNVGRYSESDSLSISRRTPRPSEQPGPHTQQEPRNRERSTRNAASCQTSVHSEIRQQSA